jgi:NAD(P)-dependent dehydrogenase (short-subunit alcohol dehydrogenase family)
MGFLYSQLMVTPPYPTHDFTGQTIIVTGSNVGLGLEAARHFVRLNAAKVILAVRNVSAGEEAKRSIESSTGRTGVCEVWMVDFASYNSVKAFAKRASSELERLDALVENAGISTEKFSLAEGEERTITINVISTFLMALLLLPKLRSTAKAHRSPTHLSIVSSETHGWAKFPEWKADNIFETLSNEKVADMTGASGRYPVSKLLGVFAVREIAPKLKDSGVILNLADPGLCHSSLSRDGSWFLFVLKAVLARSTEVGSRALVYAAGAPAQSHGQFLHDCQIGTVSDFVRSDDGKAAQTKVWKELSQKLESIQPGILKNLQ